MPKDSVVSRCPWSKWAHGQRQLHIFLQMHTLSMGRNPLGRLGCQLSLLVQASPGAKSTLLLQTFRAEKRQRLSLLEVTIRRVPPTPPPQPACSSPGVWYGGCSLWKGQWKGSHPVGIWRGVEPGSSWKLGIGREAPAALREMPIKIRKNISPQG